jgi:hypothetical protein
MKYTFTDEDYKKAFEFAVSYYLDPTKAPSGRTSAEPRGFGAVLDAFFRGKLVEIATQKLLEFLNPGKTFRLDFSIKSTHEVKDEPDIIEIRENGTDRAPKLFVEIKNTSVSDRWIGITEEQLATMKRASNGRKVFNVYISLNTKPNYISPRSTDFVGMYLKHISGLPFFKNFDDLNVYANLEFIVSVDELEKYGTKFPKDHYLYETDLFGESSSIKRSDGTLKSGIQLVDHKKSFSGTIILPRRDGTADNGIGEFTVEGSYNIYKKQNPKSQAHFLECTDNTHLENNVFGKFTLKKGRVYMFNLETMGRDPILKRNNLFIAKRRVYQLIDQNCLKKPALVLKAVAGGI